MRSLVVLIFNILGNIRIQSAEKVTSLKSQQNSSIKKLGFFYILSRISYLLALTVVTYYLAILYGFRILSLEFYFTLAIAIFSTFFAISYRRLNQLKSLMTGLLLAAAVAMVSGPILFDGVCQLEMNMMEGFSTSFSRKLTLSEACPVGIPCHVYATLSENTSEAVFINFQTNIKHSKSTICYNKAGGSAETGNFTEDYCVPTQVTSLKGVEWIGLRNVHSVYISELLPFTVYEIRIYYDGKLQKEELYRTLPLSAGELCV